MNNLDFTKASKSDIPQLIPLINGAYRSTSSKAWTGEAHILGGKRVDEEILENAFNEKDAIFFVAKQNNNILASIQVKLENDSIHIGLFAVNTDLQGQNLGKRLLEFAEHEANKIWKTNSFTMEVISTRNELIEYYERRGYKRTSRFIDFPKSELWENKTGEDLKLLVLEKLI